MSEASDDAFDRALREQDWRQCLASACDCKEPRWVRNDEGLMECLSCGVEVDE